MTSGGMAERAPRQIAARAAEALFQIEFGRADVQEVQQGRSHNRQPVTPPFRNADQTPDEYVADKAGARTSTS
jgi:hypothetical protein